MLKETQKAVVKKIESVLKPKVLIRTLVPLLVLTAAFCSLNFSKKNCSGIKIYTDTKTLCTIVAYSNIERIKGLSGVDNFLDFDAMLFVFEKEGKHGIWMKDMLMPLDIIWLDANKQIVHLEKNVSPDSYPKSFNPGSNAKYVIETKAGAIEELGLKPMYQLKW